MPLYTTLSVAKQLVFEESEEKARVYLRGGLRRGGRTGSDGKQRERIDGAANHSASNSEITSTVRAQPSTRNAVSSSVSGAMCLRNPGAIRERRSAAASTLLR